ncbi:VanZ family protein [Natronorubrum sp. FCH18a]|uniref:VanZ family protein n=1 Tax=Natronorubrum sp. FCH18a TaxID=3447018 RepID=UPI003F510DCA
MSLRIPLLPRLVRWLPSVVVAALICYWSVIATPPAGPSLETAALVGDTAALADDTVASGVGTGVADSIPDSYTRHATAYATLTLSLAYALADREAPIARKALFVFAIVTGYGALMEVGQLYQPARTTALADVLVNACGAAIALGWYGLERRARVVPVLESRRRDAV